MYGDDLEGRKEISRPLLECQTPTVVVNGHLHLRDARTQESVLQLSCASLVEPPSDVMLVALGFEEESFFVHRGSGPVLPVPDGVRLPALSPAWGVGLRRGPLARRRGDRTLADHSYATA